MSNQKQCLGGHGLSVAGQCVDFQPFPSLSKTLILLTIGLILVGLLPASLALAQQATPKSGVLQRQQSQPVPATRPAPEDTTVTAPTPATPPSGGVTGYQVVIVQIVFEGAVAEELAPELAAFAREAINQRYTLEGLQALADQVTMLLHDRGFLLASALLPPQELTNGQLTIAIAEGVMDDPAVGLNVAGTAPPRLSEERLLSFLGIAPGDQLRRPELERRVLLLNDLPGVEISASLAPGERVNTSRLNVLARGESLVNGSVSLNNHGDIDIGQLQAAAMLQVNSPLKLGDQLTLSASLSKGIRYASLGYAVPVGNHGTGANVNLSNLDYKYTRGLGQTLGYEGYSRRYAVGLSHPLVRSRQGNLFVNAQARRNDLVDDATAGNLRTRKLDIVNLGLEGNLRDPRGLGYSFGSVALVSGNLDLSGNRQDQNTDQANYRTAGNYYKLTGALGRHQPLADNLSLLIQGSGQWAGDNLDSSEQFSLGGPLGVRAYPVSEASGDSGWLLSAEVEYELPRISPFGIPRLSVFVDGGGIVLHKDTRGIATDTASGRNGYRLAGWGVSAQVVEPGSHQLQLTWAHTLGNNPGRSNAGRNADGGRDDWRIFLNLGVQF